MARDLISSDAAIKRSIQQANGTTVRVSDGAGLYLLTNVNGGAHGWRLDYSVGGSRKTISLGTYPAVTLARARRAADEAREMVRDGVDPSQARKDARSRVKRAREEQLRAARGLPAPGTFEATAREWFEQQKAGWAPAYATKILAMLERDVLPFIGRQPIAGIAPPELLEVVRRVEKRGAVDTAHRALDSCSQVFRYAIAKGEVTSNPGRDLRGALRRPIARHYPTITDPKRLGELLRACDGYAGAPVVRAALKLAPMLLLRPGELRQARWSEIDLDAAMWIVPAARMKRRINGKLNGPDHLVPLPRQAVGALRELHPLTGAGPMVFPGERHRDRAISENTVNAALRAMGFPADELTGHGFRATARTLLDEQLGFDVAVIEAQLAHSVRDSLGRAYNRTQFLDQRRRMLQAWADALDRLRSGGELKRRRASDARRSVASAGDTGDSGLAS